MGKLIEELSFATVYGVAAYLAGIAETAGNTLPTCGVCVEENNRIGRAPGTVRNLSLAILDASMRGWIVMQRRKVVIPDLNAEMYRKTPGDHLMRNLLEPGTH